MNWDDLRLLLAIERQGSFSGAAKSLGLNQSTISRRIQMAETRLNTPLVERLPEGVRLTSAGHELCRLADETDARLSLAIGKISDGRGQIDGTLTITCVDMMVDRYLARHLGAFSKAHPGINIRIKGSMAREDILRGQADIALRVSRGPDESLYGRRLGDFGLGIYGSASTQSAKSRIGLIDGHKIEARLPTPFQDYSLGHKADSFLTMSALAKAGLGIAVLPCYWADIDPSLKRLHRDCVSHPDLGLWLLFHPDKRNHPRIRAFADFFIHRFKKDRHEFAGKENTGNTL